MVVAMRAGRHGAAGSRLRRPVTLLLAAMVVAAGVVLGGVAGAEEQQGAALDRARIDVDEPLEPGGRYELPELGVRNPGTAPTAYQMAAQPTDRAEHTAKPDWFVFSPDQFALDPDDDQGVGVALELPDDAEPGGYEVLLAAQVTPDGQGARVGGAAASQLSFEIGQASQADGQGPAELGEGPGRWLALALLAALVVAGLVWLARRYELRIQRR